MQCELSQKDGDALVAEAKQAVAAEEQNLEPDLALLTTADFEVLAPTTTEWGGGKTVRAMQVMLLADTGKPNLTDQQMQHLILDGIADMQMAEHLAHPNRTKYGCGATTRSRPLQQEVPRQDLLTLWGEMFCGSIRSSTSRAPLKVAVMLKISPAPGPHSPSVRSTASCRPRGVLPFGTVQDHVPH